MTTTTTTLVSSIVLENNFACDFLSDGCPSRLQFNRVCEGPGGSNGISICDKDCFDCDLQCPQFSHDCAQCLNANCAYCPTDGTCRNSPDYPLTLENGGVTCTTRMDHIFRPNMFDLDITTNNNGDNTFPDGQTVCEVGIQQRFPTFVFTDPEYASQSWVYDMIRVESVWENLGLTGAGIRVRINDAGLDPSHPDFQINDDDEESNGNGISRINTNTNVNCDNSRLFPQDDSRFSMHGMYVAGIIGAGANNGVCAVGIAPAVTLNSCRAVDTPNFLNQQVTSNAYDIANTSFGTDGCAPVVIRTRFRHHRRRSLRPSSLNALSSSSSSSSYIPNPRREQHLHQRSLQQTTTCPFLHDITNSIGPCEICTEGEFELSAFELLEDNLRQDCQEAIQTHCTRNYENDEDACDQFLEVILGGPEGCFYTQLSTSDETSLQTGVETGRDGKGIIYVFAGGNAFARGDDTNFQALTNTRYGIAVGAVGKDRLHASYSTTGASLLVTAPGGDRGSTTNHVSTGAGESCVEAGSGTSFSAAVVSGVVALMLEANSELTWRDVQDILVRTSQRVEEDPNDDTAIFNGIGLWHSNMYGFGIVNAEAAVAAAIDRDNANRLIGPEQVVQVSSETLNIPIVDDATESIEVSLTVDVDVNTLSQVESVEVALDLSSRARGHLEILLTSPSGTVSRLVPGQRPEITQISADRRWTLMTVRNWGESPNGEWTLKLTDLKGGDTSATCISDSSWFLQFSSGQIIDCAFLKSRRICIDGEKDPLVNVVNQQTFDTIFSTMASGRLAEEACCSCGGTGIGPLEDIENEFKEWTLTIYGTNGVRAPTAAPALLPTDAPVAPIPTNAPVIIPIDDEPDTGPDGPPTKAPSICNSFTDATSCLADQADSSCFWCVEDNLCRSSFGKCPSTMAVGIANKTPSNCMFLITETPCATEDCVWCGTSEVCRDVIEECPGVGRGNPCNNPSIDDCDTVNGCIVSQERETCVLERGLPSNEPEPDGFARCPLLSTEDDCVATTQCRWCEEDAACRGILDFCQNGNVGIRGNPCNPASSEDLCVNIENCLWCSITNQCRKASNDACSEVGTDEPNTRQCSALDAQPECDLNNECQWCQVQNRCKDESVVCGTPSGEVDLALVDASKGSLKIYDNALGETDPNQVSISLRQIYEITEDGATIASSLIDLQAQNYEVRQTIDQFFGGVGARRLEIETDIPGVGKIKLDTYIMLTNGSITILESNEVLPVKRGDVKFSIVLSDWSFCDEVTPCGDSSDSSSFIDVAIEVNGALETPMRDSENELLFNLGGNVPLLLSNMVNVDGTTRRLPNGFPRMEISDIDGHFFVFRFPRFSDILRYDPLIPYHAAIITDDFLRGQSSSIPSFVPTIMPTEEFSNGDLSEGANGSALSIGAIVGIALGAVVIFLCCILAIALGCLRLFDRSQQRKAEDETPYPTVAVHDRFRDEEIDNNNGNSESDSDDESDDSSSEDDSILTIP